jgi:hypothetical protein
MPTTPLPARNILDGSANPTTSQMKSALGQLHDNLTQMQGGISGNTAVGYGALENNTTGSQNTASGNNALNANTAGIQNTASGSGALYSNTTGNYNTANGRSALYYNTTGSQNTANGSAALNANTTGSQNTASGRAALNANTTGSYNTANGISALYSNTTGIQNTASGQTALYNNTTGSQNTASGNTALFYNTTGIQNTASGGAALYNNTTGSYNTASGNNALFYNTTGGYNTATGHGALNANIVYTNCGGFGYNAQVTGSNQIQLGNSATTTYVYGAVANRSDARDKTDIKDTEFGLDFIMKLRPVDYRWDYREDYKPARPADIEPLKEDATDEEKAAHEAIKVEHAKAIQDWLEACKLANIVRNGSKKRTRFHHGFIAQEVQAIIEQTGKDFGGLQHLSVKGGEDVYTLGYMEMIAPLTKAIQEQQSLIESLTARIAALEAK